jgi:hypothetical protein
MKRKLAGVVIFLITGSMGSCGTSIVQVSNDGGNRDASKSCGGSGEPCCNGVACDNGFTCRGGTCSGSSTGADSGSSPGVDSGSSGADADATADTSARDARIDAATSYKEAVLSDNPAGYWRLDEDGSVAADISGNDRNGTYEGDVTKLAPGALLNDRDPGIILDGTSGYVTTGFLQTSVTAYSIEGWIRTTASAAGYFTGPIFQDRGAGTGLSLTLVMAGSDQSPPCTAGALMFVFDTADYEAGVCSNSTYNDGTWHHVVATFSAATGTSIQCGTTAWPNWTTWTSSNCPEFQLYVDGVSVGGLASGETIPFSSPLTGSGPAIIGYHQPWDVYWPGSVDEVAVYLSALSATRVVAHYHAAGY